jgi:uncharacterized protein (DUF4213/DUF364 family)
VSDKWAIYDELLAGIPADLRIKASLVGRNWCVVESEGTGLALNYRGDIGEGDIRAPYAGRTVAEVAGLIKGWSLPDASLAVAAMNSVYNAPERVAGWLNKPLDAVRSETAFDELFAAMVGKKVAVIGHFPGLQKVADRCQLSILERAPQEGDLPDFAAEYVLPEQDFVFVTGTTLTNKTLPRLLELSAGATTVLVGPSVPLAPVWFDWGIDILAGTVVLDQAAVWQAGLDGEHKGIFERGAAMVQITPADVAAR